MMKKVPLTIVYPGPSLHAVDFFSALHEHGGFDLQVLFCLPEFITRTSWPSPRMDFRYEYLPSKRLSRTNEFAVWNSGLLSRIRSGVRQRRIHLLGGGYSMPSIAMAMLSLSRMRAQWYFQSEKPGISSNPVKSWLRCLAIEACLGRCTRILAHSQLALEEYIKLGFDLAKVTYLPYFMNVNEFRAIDRSWAGIESRPIRVLYCGQLHEIKGIDWAVNALTRMGTLSSEFSLDIVGEGPLRSKLDEDITRSGLSNIRLLGPVEWEKRSKTFACHDVLLLPSRHDGWGMVVMEALAAGMPVLGSLNSGAVHACVREGENGWQFSYRDDGALQEALRKCINSRANLSAMGQRARASVADWRPELGAQQLWNIIHEDELRT